MTAVREENDNYCYSYCYSHQCLDATPNPTRTTTRTTTTLNHELLQEYYHHYCHRHRHLFSAAATTTTTTPAPTQKPRLFLSYFDFFRTCSWQTEPKTHDLRFGHHGQCSAQELPASGQDILCFLQLIQAGKGIASWSRKFPPPVPEKTEVSSLVSNGFSFAPIVST